jgi:hypothetical protein
MFTNQIALVSQTPKVKLDQLVLVSAALQKQVNRDFRRYWDIEASVDAFGALKDVPLGYWQIIIMDKIPFRAQGIHLNRDNGQPYSLVKYSTNWPLTTSHESLEMLADPYGSRVQSGISVKEGQGRVDYLVEVCDPSEAAEFGYSVNGILLSDFYTPDFFNPVADPKTKYSFTGAISEPRQVLDGGYLSWFEPVTKHVWQLFVDGNEKEFVDQGVLPGGFSLRAFSDRKSAEFRAGHMEEADGPGGLMLTGGLSDDVNEFDEAGNATAVSLQAQIDALIS